MSAKELACRASTWASSALAHPAALPTYIAARVALQFLFPPAVVAAQSDFANVALILLAAGQNKQGNTVERGVRALVEANPDTDAAEIESP